MVKIVYMYTVIHRVSYGGGGGGGVVVVRGSLGSPPPKNSQGCYCITYKQVYSRNSNRSNNIKIYSEVHQSPTRLQKNTMILLFENVHYIVGVS